jgi:hypothetical protein
VRDVWELYRWVLQWQNMNMGREYAEGGLRSEERLERERMELSRAEKLKLWQSTKHSSGRKNVFSSITTNPLRKQTNNKSILFKKKNVKRFSDLNLSEMTKSANDLENSCPNESKPPQSTKTMATTKNPFSTPVKSLKMISSKHQSPFVDLDGYVTANEEDQMPPSLEPSSPSSPLPSPSASTSASASASASASPSFLSFLNDKLTKENSALRNQFQISQRIQNEAMEVAKMAQNEIECLLFANDVLNQKSLQMEEQLTKERMRYREKDHQKVDKYKEEIRTLKGKNSEYERRANEMVAEMNLQMSQLQDMAMSRIEV